MNEWMCLSPRLFTVMHLQFIFINIGCIKATQGTNNNRNIERRSNVQRSMSTSSSIAFRKREKGRRVKIHKIIWMNEHTHLNPSVCLCVLVGRPYVGIFYRWHQFFVHENGINEGRSRATRERRRTTRVLSAFTINYYYKRLACVSSFHLDDVSISFVVRLSLELANEIWNKSENRKLDQCRVFQMLLSILWPNRKLTHVYFLAGQENEYSISNFGLHQHSHWRRRTTFLSEFEI